jgi:hypothetical protein
MVVSVIIATPRSVNSKSATSLDATALRRSAAALARPIDRADVFDAALRRALRDAWLGRGL